jgi:hypothetical protein
MHELSGGGKTQPKTGYWDRVMLNHLKYNISER